MKAPIHEFELTNLFENSFDAIILTNSIGRIQFMNALALQIFQGVLPEDLMNKRIQKIIHNKKLDDFFKFHNPIQQLKISIQNQNLLLKGNQINENICVFILHSLDNIQKNDLLIKEYQSSLQAIYKILDEVQDGMCFIAEDQSIKYYNQKMAFYCLIEPTGALNQHYSILENTNSINLKDLPFVMHHKKSTTLYETFISTKGQKQFIQKDFTPLFVGNKYLGTLIQIKPFTDYTSDFSTHFSTKQDNEPHQKDYPFKMNSEIIEFSNHPKMKKIKLLIENNVNQDVFIFGEEGTGKRSLTEKLLVNQKKERHSKVYFMNCETTPEQVIDEVLFTSDLGIIYSEITTLILYHIEKLSSNLQRKLSNHIHTLDRQQIKRARIISISTQHPRTSIQSASLNEDLFYQLSTELIELPALRERISDIRFYTLLFINIFNEKLGKKITISEEAIQTIEKLMLKGNLLRLKYFIFSLVQKKADSEEITLYCLPEELFSNAPNEEHKHNTFNKISDSTLTDYLEEIERREIERALIEMEGNITHTAQYLGISRQSLNYKLSKYEVDTKRRELE